MSQATLSEIEQPPAVSRGGEKLPSNGPGSGPPLSTRTHVIDTAFMAGPIAMGQISKQLIQAATLVLFGMIHPATLAAGGLAVRITITTHILSAVLLTVGVSVAAAQGAGEVRRISSLYWHGLYLSGLLSLVSFVWFTYAHLLLTALSLPPEVIVDTQTCLDIMRWAEPANLISLGLMRGVLPAFGLARILYVLTPLSLVIYAGGSILLDKGAFGLPPLGWLGIPISLVVSRWVTAGVMLAMVHATRHRRHIPLVLPRMSALLPMLRVGVPIGITQGLDTLFFFTTTLMIGRLGAIPLAAHQIVMSYGTLVSSFAISSGDAGSLRVGFFRGGRAFADARRAGFIGMAMSVAVTSIAAVAVASFPDFFLALFIDIHAPQNQAVVAASRELIFVGIAFVLVDGVYLASLGLPRATQDNRFAAIAVPVVYWCLGLSTAYLLSSSLNLGLIGFWYGFILALTLNAVVLTARFAWVSRLDRAAAFPVLASADARRD